MNTRLKLEKLTLFNGKSNTNNAPINVKPEEGEDGWVFTYLPPGGSGTGGDFENFFKKILKSTLFSFAAAIRVVTHRSSPLMAAHSSSAFLSSN